MIITEPKINDEILQELWKIKDNYSNSCNKNFKKLVGKLKKDAKHLISNKKIVNLHKWGIKTEKEKHCTAVDIQNIFLYYVAKNTSDHRQTLHPIFP